MLMPASQVSEMKFGTPKAMREANGMQEAENHRGTQLVTQATDTNAKDVIYVYNITGVEHVIEQPPSFPHFVIPGRQKGEKFAVTMLPRFVNDRFNKAGTTEYYYARRDGREAANSLMNPDAHPGNPWAAQLNENPRFGNGDQTGNNMNAFGCFWSLTKPDDPALEAEIKLFADRYDKTMRALVNKGEELNASSRRAEITPLMHQAMEHFQLQAAWHMSHARLTPCPNCGEPVREGIAYHKNEFGDRCIIDQARYEKSIGVQQPATAVSQAIPSNQVAKQEVSEEKLLDDMSAEELAAVVAGSSESKSAAKKKAGK